MESFTVGLKKRGKVLTHIEVMSSGLHTAVIKIELRVHEVINRARNHLKNQTETK